MTVEKPATFQWCFWDWKNGSMIKGGLSNSMRQTTVKFIARGFVDVFQVDSS